MATTLTTSPAFPAEGDTVTLTVTGSSYEVFALEVTSVPPDSELPLGFLLSSDIDTAAQAAVLNSAQSVVDTPNAAGFSFLADRGGEYEITVWEFLKFEATAAAFEGDPVADARSELKATTALTVDVGPSMLLPIITAKGDGATLSVKVNGTTIRSAELINETTEKARLAAQQATVTAALAALVGSADTAIGNELVDDANDLSVNFAAHIVTSGSWHGTSDTINTVNQPPAKSQDDAITLVNELRERILGHFRDGAITGLSVDWHVAGEEDTKNLPLASFAVDVPSAVVTLSDLRYRCYELHRQHATGESPPFDDPEVHDETDNTNTLTASTLLDDLIKAFFDALADTGPTAVAGESEGAQTLTSKHGFTRSG